MLHTFSALALVVHVVGSPTDSVPLRRDAQSPRCDGRSKLRTAR